MKNKTICVTGGSGFIASHLIKALKKENPKQIINLDLKTGYNLTQYRELEVFFEQNKVDIVYDLATLPLPMSLVQPYKVTSDIVTMVLNLCELQRQGLFGRLIHMSSSEAYGNAVSNVMKENQHHAPRTPYAAAKASADLIALSYVTTFHNDIIIPRSFNAYGPGQPLNWGAVIPKTIGYILKNESPFIYGTGEQTRDFVFVKDIAKGIIELSKIDPSGIVVNIGSGIETSITYLVELICKLMDFKGNIIRINSRAGDVVRHRADITKLFELTGYTPSTMLAEGLLETINYYVNLHPAKAVRS